MKMKEKGKILKDVLWTMLITLPIPLIMVGLFAIAGIVISIITSSMKWMMITTTTSVCCFAVAIIIMRWGK